MQVTTLYWMKGNHCYLWKSSSGSDLTHVWWSKNCMHEIRRYLRINSLVSVLLSSTIWKKCSWKILFYSLREDSHLSIFDLSTCSKFPKYTCIFLNESPFAVYKLDYFFTVTSEISAKHLFKVRSDDVKYKPNTTMQIDKCVSTTKTKNKTLSLYHRLIRKWVWKP